MNFLTFYLFLLFAESLSATTPSDTVFPGETAVFEVKRTNPPNPNRETECPQHLAAVISNMQHDFNNLATVLMSAADLVRNGVATGDQEMTGTGATLIENATEMMVGMGNAMRAIASRQVFGKELIEVRYLLEQWKVIFQNAVNQNIKLEIELEIPSLRVYVNRSILFNALLNLILNASRFSPAGSKIKISVRLTRPFSYEHCLLYIPLTRTLPSPCTFAEFEVTDEGEGFSQISLSAIGQGEAYSSKKPDGNPHGVGLQATIKNILAGDGAFSIQGRRDGRKGSSVSIYLPTAPR